MSCFRGWPKLPAWFWLFWGNFGHHWKPSKYLICHVFMMLFDNPYFLTSKPSLKTMVAETKTLWMFLWVIFKPNLVSCKIMSFDVNFGPFDIFCDNDRIHVHFTCVKVIKLYCVHSNHDNAPKRRFLLVAKVTPVG